MPDLDDAARADLLKAEYLHLQTVIEEFDGKSLTIKAWSVTLSAAAIVAAYVETVPFALIVGSLSAVAFWLVEAFRKTNQQAFYWRVTEIEQWMAGEAETIHPLQIARSWSRKWHSDGRNWRALGLLAWPHVAMPHVAMPHVAIVLAGLVLCLWVPPGAGLPAAGLPATGPPAAG